MRNAVLLVALVLMASCVTPQLTNDEPVDALDRLRDGNARMVSGKPEHPRQSTSARTAVATEQHPFAIVVGCSDSRVPPELVFDQGLGDLFVVRSAGQVVDAPALGSIEYALAHLGSRLVVVLGHEHCGAVKAAIDGGAAPPNIQSLITAIRPAVDEVSQMSGDKLDLAVRANVNRVVRQLRNNSPGVRVVGMYYDLDTGKVEVLP